MKSALITGANKGIGLETAKQLQEGDFYVYLGSRDLKNGQAAVESLKVHGLTHVEVVQLDVTNEKSVAAAREQVGERTRGLDVLVNNAGINGGAPYSAFEAQHKQYLLTFDTNVFGVARVTRAFIDLLYRSPAPRIVNVTSSVGSLSLQSDPNWPGYHFAKFAVYGASKAALNMYTVHLAYELRNTAFKVNAVCPGYTETEFTGYNGGEIEIAGRRIVKYALLDEQGPTGKFISEETNPESGEIPW